MSDHSDPLDRRRLLGGVSAAICATVAGCASLDGSRTTTERRARVAIVLANRDDTERDYEIEVVWGGTDRSQFSGTLQPAESGTEMLATTGTAPETATVFVGAADGGQSGTWSPTDCPDYRVDAVIEDGTPSFDTTCRA